MLLDWTHYSRFVSNQVKYKCCGKGGQPASSKTSDNPLKSRTGSVKLLGSAGSLGLADNLTTSVSFESGLEIEGENHQVLNQKIMLTSACWNGRFKKI